MTRGRGTERLTRRDVTLIHNPTSGDEAVAVEAILGLLAEAGYRVRHVASDGPWQEALGEPTDLVAVLGGDGTVGQVLTALVGRETPVGILPGGTANNIARTLAIGGRATSVIARWATAEARPLDIWEVRDGRSARFVEAWGGGFMGRLIERGRDAEKPSLILGGALDRARHLLADIVAAAPEAEWRVDVDGVDHSGAYIGVEAMSIRAIGPNAPFAPDADPGDGRVDVALIDAGRRDALLHAIAARASDGRAEWPDIPTVTGRMVRLVPPAGAPLHIDDSTWDRPEGDDAHDEPLSIGLAGKARYLANG
jgi:diacylglycerol kinase (ATP)